MTISNIGATTPFNRAQKMLSSETSEKTTKQTPVVQAPTPTSAAPTNVPIIDHRNEYLAILQNSIDADSAIQAHPGLGERINQEAHLTPKENILFHQYETAKQALENTARTLFSQAFLEASPTLQARRNWENFTSQYNLILANHDGTATWNYISLAENDVTPADREFWFRIINTPHDQIESIEPELRERVIVASREACSEVNPFRTNNGARLNLYQRMLTGLYGRTHANNNIASIYRRNYSSIVSISPSETRRYFAMPRDQLFREMERVIHDMPNYPVGSENLVLATRLGNSLAVIMSARGFSAANFSQDLQEDNIFSGLHPYDWNTFKPRLERSGI